MHIATALLRGVSPYSQSKAVAALRVENESHEEHRERTWREQMHVDSNGIVFIPPMALKNALSECAKFLGLKIEGKRNATWTKHFEAGIAIQEPVSIGVNANEVASERLYLPADGVRGSGKRVWKVFPVIPEWQGTATFLILDKAITPAIFEHHLRECGRFIGIGRFRPRNNGYYGRFEVKEFTWE